MPPLIQAQQALTAGRPHQAKQLLLPHLRQHPNDLDGLYLLGICEQAAGDTSAAETLYRRILARQPGHFGAHYNLALLLSSTGRDREALPHHDAAVRLQPQQVWAYVNRGNAKSRLGDHEGAAQDYRQALAIDAQRPEAWTNLGNALRELGELDEALQAHARALTLNAQLVDAWINQAATLLAMGRPEEGLQAATRATELAPHAAQAWLNKGAALQALRQLDEAIACHERALQLDGKLADAWLNRGIALSDLRQHAAALASYEQALALRPNDGKIWFYRGLTERDLKAFDAAIKSFEHALELSPDQERLPGYLLLTRMQCCDWDGLPQHAELIQARIRQGFSAATPLSLMGAIDEPSLLHAAAEQVASQVAQRVAALRLEAFTRTDQTHGKIRLGLYSADFREHPVAQLTVDLIESLDRSRFEVYAFAFTPETPSPLRARIAQAVDQFIDVSGHSDRQIVELSRSQGIAIAIDLGGHTDGARTSIFALRAAPIQVNYLGFPGTMGAPYIDYILADPVVCPPGSEAYYTEKVVRLPHCFMPRDRKQPVSDQPMRRSDFGLPEQGIVFCCFNNHQKINPPVFDVWMRLLKAIDGSVLWLSDGPPIVKDNLAREAQARGVDPARLVYAQRVEDMAQHLARYRLADLFLDTRPYNAHTTASDALWAGLPVLTCPGQSFASRVAASLLHAVGLPELVTSTMEEYEALALQLARDPNRLTALRAKLASQRLTAPLFDTPRLARAMEQAFEAMVERHRQGLPPDTIDVPDPDSVQVCE